MPPKYHVIFRACDKVVSVHGAPRPFELDKQTLIKICFLSLYEAIQPVVHQIHVVGDDISPSLQDFFSKFPAKVVLGEWGNSLSIRQCVDIGLEIPDNEWVYFCEDDYLHTPNAFQVIDDLVRNRRQYLAYKPRPYYMGLFIRNFDNTPLVIHPPDYPDRYKPKKLRLSYIFLSEFCHWRQVTNSTFTLMLEAKTLKRYKNLFYRSAKFASAKRYAASGRLSKKMYGHISFHGKALCLSPIPGLACHMHNDLFTPFVDWKSIYEANLAQLNQDGQDYKNQQEKK